MTDAPSVLVETVGAARLITINRPAVRNAVDGPTAQLLYDAFVEYDRDQAVSVAVLTGADGTFCSGADLQAVSTGHGNHVGQESTSDIVDSVGPMGPTRLRLDKPVIAAVEGHAVAGGLELACWADLRVAARGAVLGVYCCLRGDRASMTEQRGRSLGDALHHEMELGMATIRTGETRAGAQRFAGGAGRHGSFDSD